MSDTQTLEGIKAAAPEASTHYHFGLQVYLHKKLCSWYYKLPSKPWLSFDRRNDEIQFEIQHHTIIVLADIPDDMAASMPFQLLEGDEEKPRSKYHREIKPGVWIDCYDVLKAFDVRCPALQHIIKKCLAPGQRGHKDLEQDMNDIVASANRARELAKC